MILQQITQRWGVRIRHGGARKIPFLTLTVSPIRRAWITLSGCNFKCKGCFALARHEIGEGLSPRELLELFLESCQQFYGAVVRDVVITGGEPTLDEGYLVSLCAGLRDAGVERITLSTNGHLLDDNLIVLLKPLVDLVLIDLKVYDGRIHQWYTGESNSGVLKAVGSLHRHGYAFRVETLLIPGIVDIEEIERIAEFLGCIDRQIPLKINEFAPEYAEDPISRRPYLDEIKNAVWSASRHLDSVSAGKSCDVGSRITGAVEYVKVYASGLLKLLLNSDKVASSKYGWKYRYIDMSSILKLRSSGQLSSNALETLELTDLLKNDTQTASS